MSPGIGAASIRTTAPTKVHGEKRALDSVGGEVEEGSIFGFLGPNGAGKTTALRILAGLASATSGSVQILGQNVATAGNSVRAQSGFLPDVPGFYEWMRAEGFLRVAGGLFGIGGRVLDERAGVVLDLAGLSDVDTEIGGYSRGMKQRLGVAQAPSPPTSWPTSSVSVTRWRSWIAVASSPRHPLRAS